jgi:hypothetical protein
MKLLANLRENVGQMGSMVPGAGELGPGLEEGDGRQAVNVASDGRGQSDPQKGQC